MMRTCPQRLLKLHINIFMMDQLHEAVQNYSKKRWTHSYLKLTSIYLRMLYCLNVLLWFYLGMYIKKIGTSSNQETNSRRPVRTSLNQFGQPDRNNQIGPANSDNQFGPLKETLITLVSRKIWRPMSTRWKDYEVYFPTQQVSRHFDLPIRIYDRIIEDCSECQESARGFILLNFPYKTVAFYIVSWRMPHVWKAYQV